MTSMLTATVEERVDDTTLRRIREQVQDVHPSNVPEPTAPEPEGWLSRFLENAVAKPLGHRHFVKLAADRGRVSQAWRELPARMHLVANQTKLMMELIDDFRSGTYRAVRWRSLAIAAGAILYAASPADVVPDVLLGLGQLDDIAVAALAARMLRKEREEYCRFKGYAVEDYFPAQR
jgi:uncharacterized membrane protein YkvA (DUF1232 family)